MEASNQRIANEKIFRYEVMWERYDDFKSTLKTAWGSSRASNIDELQEKLQSTTIALTGWGSASFGAVRMELRELRRKLQGLCMDALRSGPSNVEKKVGGVDSRVICYREEIMWKQRARVQWLAEDDLNSRFFHQKACNRMTKNRIEKLTRDDGTVCEN
jgi:hypothetical protein